MTGFARLKNDAPQRVIFIEELSELIGKAPTTTVHSSQGLTNDRALIALDTKSRSTLMNLYYVAISRARYEARVYTNSRRRNECLPGLYGEQARSESNEDCVGS
ncbi:C-terminal helicase domain-containing protein [Ralstonia sp. UBA689]|uniref:C-terminal helicase domain-containing protein n=1 Tax=Ralstonia sp. UBA689 TaxID=1947373 RepID=UPI0025F2ABD0|nr:helicase C-terminal domain-containing protein [Ralstonia sp. UBA689]